MSLSALPGFQVLASPAYKGQMCPSPEIWTLCKDELMQVPSTGPKSHWVRR